MRTRPIVNLDVLPPALRALCAQAKESHHPGPATWYALNQKAGLDAARHQPVRNRSLMSDRLSAVIRCGGRA